MALTVPLDTAPRRMTSQARLPRRDILRLNTRHLSKHKLHLVGAAVIDERDKHRLGRRQFLAIELYCEDSSANPQRIFHGYVIPCSTVLVGDFESGPAMRDAGGEHQIGALDAKPQQPFQCHAIQPSGRASVPRPATTADMRGFRIDIRAGDVGFHLVTVHLALIAGVINWI